RRLGTERCLGSTRLLGRDEHRHQRRKLNRTRVAGRTAFRKELCQRLKIKNAADHLCGVLLLKTFLLRVRQGSGIATLSRTTCTLTTPLFLSRGSGAGSYRAGDNHLVASSRACAWGAGCDLGSSSGPALRGGCRGYVAYFFNGFTVFSFLRLSLFTLSVPCCLFLLWEQIARNPITHPHASGVGCSYR